MLKSGLQEYELIGSGGLVNASPNTRQSFAPHIPPLFTAVLRVNRTVSLTVTLEKDARIAPSRTSIAQDTL